MTPRELLAREPETIGHDFAVLFYGRDILVPELGENPQRFTTTVSERIEIRVYKHHTFSCGRRFWRLAAVFFDGEPVMITQNAGREGDDHVHRFIVDAARYGAMVGHLLSLLREVAFDDHRDTTRISMDDDVAGLTSFYCGELDGRFEG